MKRRDLLVAATGLGLTGGAVANGTAKTRPNSSGPTRNILLIIADDQGYDLSCCGGRVKNAGIGQFDFPGNIVHARIRNGVFLQFQPVDVVHRTLFAYQRYVRAGA